MDVLAAPSPPILEGGGVGTLVVLFLPAGRPDRSGPLTPQPPTPSLTHPIQGRFQKISDRETSPPPHHSSELWESQWESSDQVGCVDHGVWGGAGVDHTPTSHPKPHIPDPGKVQKISDQKTFFSAYLQKGTLGVAMGE